VGSQPLGLEQLRSNNSARSLEVIGTRPCEQNRTQLPAASATPLAAVFS